MGNFLKCYDNLYSFELFLLLLLLFLLFLYLNHFLHLDMMLSWRYTIWRGCPLWAKTVFSKQLAVSTPLVGHCDPSCWWRCSLGHIFIPHSSLGNIPGFTFGCLYQFLTKISSPYDDHVTFLSNISQAPFIAALVFIHFSNLLYIIYNHIKIII